MPKSISLSIIVCFVLSLGGAVRANAETVIAFWDFNDGFDVADETVQITHSATIGSGTIYQQRADTDGNGKGGQAYSNVVLGIDSVDGRAIAWDDVAKSGDNDAELFVEFSTTGFTNINVRFDVRGNGDGANNEIISYDLKYANGSLEDISFGGGTIKDFAGGVSNSLSNNQPLLANGDDFITETIDLSAVTDINNQANVAIRLDDFEQNNAMRIDNFLVTGVSAIPEPSGLGFVASAIGLCCLGRRTRRQ